MKKIFGLLLCVVIILGCTCTGFAAAIRDTMPDTWVGGSLDANCMMPGYDQVGGRRSGTNVGMFYYIWHADSIGRAGIKNIYQINNGLMDWGSINGFHYWDEPWLGYYDLKDPFVIRKHAQMLTDAGVDVILFDNTNGILYADTILQIMKVYTAMREEGNDTPQISSIMHNTDNVDIVIELYDKFFGPNVSAEVSEMTKNLWYKWNGKYLLLADRNQVFNNGASPAFVKNNFEVRTSWINGGQYCWPWTAASWNAYGYTTNSGIAEQTFVTSADPSVSGKGKSSNQSVFYRDGDSRINPRLGTFFKAQWEKALSINPPFILVTQFNEWIAQRQPDNSFVDLWSWEFNRDIEPMKHHGPNYGYGDNYMYYLNYYIRRYKGVRQLPSASSAVTIDITDSFSQWDNVAPQYLDDINDTIHRYHPASGTDTLRQNDEFYYLDPDNDTAYYINNTGRNDFDTMKVARDAGYVYFYVKTTENITAPDNESTWMQLLINTNASYNDGWYGYDYILNRKIDLENNYGMLEKSLGGWSWNEIGEVELRIEGNQMMVAIPREWLGYDASMTSNISLDFKWLDNVRCSESGFDPMDFIDKGDVAPNDRYNYRYKADFPAIRYNAVSLDTMTIDVNMYPGVSARILSAMSGDVPTATKVEYLSETTRGIIDENGTFIQQLLIGSYHEKLRYHLLDDENNVLGFGIVILTNEDSAPIFYYQGAGKQSFVPNHNAKTGVFYVSYESKLWDVILSETAPGDFYLDGTHINGYNVFNFYKEDPVGLVLEYREYDQSVTYTIDIVREDAPQQVANTMTLFAGNTLPGSDSLWEAKKVGGSSDFEVNVIHGSSCYTHVSDDSVALFGLKKPYAAPYIFDFQTTVDDKGALVPHHSCLVNIRGTSSEEYITSYLGIWFGVIRDQVILMKNANGFADMANYSVATIENGIDVSAEFGNIVVNDSGEQITISAIDASGATVKLFEITNITNTSFDYENLITGEKATATSKQIAGKDSGYITFFRHPSAKIGYRNIKLGPNLEKIKAGLVTFSLLDPTTMSEISDSVVISNDDSSRTINITVGYDADISKVVVSYVPALYGTRVLVGGKPISKTPITQLKNGSGSIIMVGGGTTRTYKVTITRTLVPKFRFKDVDAQVINVDNINNVITATVGRGTKLEALTLEVLSAGSATVDGMALDGTPMNFSKNPTGRTLVYTEGEESKTYTLNVYMETVIPTASTFQFKDIIFQTTAVDNENKIITITLGKGTPTNNLRLLTATSGSKTYIDGIDSAYEWFNFDNNLTGHTLVYDDGGEPITYTFNIEVDALPEQGATKLIEQFTCDTMPTANDTWQCVEIEETGDYCIGEGYGNNAIYLDYPDHHLISTRKTIVTPYVFDFEFSLIGNSLAPHFGNMFNICSDTNNQFMTSYEGIWFSAYNNNLMLYTSNQYGISFADPAAYSIVTTENTRSFNGQGYVAIRIVDNGNQVVVKYRNDNGKYVDAFTLSGIGSTSFSFKNMQTGATGTGYSEGILRDGYINFFHHGGLDVNMYLNQFSFYSATDSFESYITNFDLIDPVSGRVATQNVEIDKDAKTISAEVIADIPLTALKASYTATVANGVLMQGSNHAESVSLDYTDPITLTYTDGQVTENYTVTVTSAAPATGRDFVENEKVKVGYANTTGKAIDNVCFLIGCYDADGRLISVIRQVRTVNAQRNIYDIEISDICPENTAFVKLFSWENAGSLNPLASAGAY